jgi:hypothetical protein
VRSVLLLVALIGSATPAIQAQDVSFEYQVKAAYLFNFVKFVDWPARAQAGPITICVIGRNPFGSALDDTVRGEAVNGRSIVARTAAEVDARCHVVFVPQGVATAGALRAARMSPMVTVGESNNFIRDGGIINFVLDNGTVRFEINQQAASRVGIQISSRLLRLARPRDQAGPAQ